MIARKVAPGMVERIALNQTETDGNPLNIPVLGVDQRKECGDRHRVGRVREVRSDENLECPSPLRRLFKH
jgi:hypothetical protein